MVKGAAFPTSFLFFSLAPSSASFSRQQWTSRPLTFDINNWHVKKIRLALKLHVGVYSRRESSSKSVLPKKLHQLIVAAPHVARPL